MTLAFYPSIPPNFFQKSFLTAYLSPLHEKRSWAFATPEILKKNPKEQREIYDFRPEKNNDFLPFVKGKKLSVQRMTA